MVIWGQTDAELSAQLPADGSSLARDPQLPPYRRQSAPDFEQIKVKFTVDEANPVETRVTGHAMSSLALIRSLESHLVC